MWAAAAAGASVNVFTACSGHAAQVGVSAGAQQTSKGAAASQQNHADMVTTCEVKWWIYAFRACFCVCAVYCVDRAQKLWEDADTP